MEGVAGLSAWRWMYLIEGILTCVSATIAVLFLPGWPEEAKFLNPEEKKCLLSELQEASGNDREAETTWSTLVRVVGDPKVHTRYVCDRGACGNETER